MRKIILSIVLLLMFGNITEKAQATPLYLTFSINSVQGSMGINSNDYIGTKYIYKVEFNEAITKGSHTDSNGDIVYYDDLVNSDRFYTEKVAGNYISLNDSLTYFTNAPQKYNLGVWTVFDELKENAFGTGATYGTFYYQTRMSLYTESFDDLVSINGFWYERIDPSYPNSILTPGVKWMIYDRDYHLNGVEIFGSFWASLINVSATNPIAKVPEPATLLMLGFGIIGVTLLRRFKPSPETSAPIRQGRQQ